MRAVGSIEDLPVRAARAGDPEAWDALFRRFQLPLYAYVHEWIDDEQTSLDLVQETFINATRHIKSLRDEAKFGSWLFGIARQKVWQRWRKPDRTEPLNDDADAYEFESGINPRDCLIREEEEALFMRHLHQLPAAQRDVLLLHFLEDFTLEEIATIVEVPLGTVKSRMHHAKKAFRNLLNMP